MTITIQQALRPLFLMYFIVGLGVYPVKQPKLRIQWIINLSKLYSLIIWSLYIYIVYRATNLFTLRQIFFTTINSIVAMINNLATITSCFVGFYYQKRFEICMIKLNAVDNTLEQLGTMKIYERMYIWSRQVIIGWLLFIFITNVCSIYILIRNYNAFWALILSIVINHCIHIDILVDSLFVTFLWYVGNRFDKVHEHIKCLLREQELGIRCTLNESVIVINESPNNYKKVFWTIMHLYIELHRIVRELNLMFGMQMTLQTASYFIYLTIFWYHIFLLATSEYSIYVSLFDWLATYLWGFSFLIRQYILNMICDIVKYKANEIDKTIHQLTSIIQYADIWKEIYQFTLQAMHHPLKFTGMGLFQFGQKFLWKFYITVSTYVMIMIQLDLHDDYIELEEL